MRIVVGVRAAVLTVVLAAAGCADTVPSAPTDPTPTPPPAGTGFDYQLAGGYPPADPQGVVVRDSRDEPLPGAYNICYVNGFQTQPDESSTWLAEHPDLLLRDAAGTPVVDPQWPDEYVLDPGGADNRAAILAVVGERLDACRRAGFAAVEIDNLDTFTRFDGIARADALALAADYVERGRRSGLVVGQKNAAELAGTGRREVGFGFAIAEECFAFDECGSYTAAYGERVYDVEYPDSLDVDFDVVCASADRPAATILRDRGLTTSWDPDHRYRSC